MQFRYYSKFYTKEVSRYLKIVITYKRGITITWCVMSE